MSKQKVTEKPLNTGSDSASESDTHTNISTADDVNVDEDNAIDSPKESLTAIEPEEPKR